jgi:DNA repair ATPase RecN
MFWNDITEMKEALTTLIDRFIEMDSRIQGISQDRCDAYDSQEESLNRLHDKLTCLMNADKLLRQVELSQQTLDKFEDYMKNVHKLNEMINEFKGCVSVARAAIADKKEMDDMRNTLKSMIETCHKYFNYQKTISDQYFKIDAIYKKLCEEQPKIPKKKVIRKKKVTSPSNE